MLDSNDTRIFSGTSRMEPYRHFIHGIRFSHRTFRQVRADPHSCGNSRFQFSREANAGRNALYRRLP